MSRNRTNSKSKPAFKTRKEIRKEKRQLKKVKRNEYYLNKRTLKNTDFSEDEESPILGRTNHLQKVEKSEKIDPEMNSSVSERQIKQKRKEDMELKKLERGMKVQRVKLLQDANEDEDKVIRNLQKKLKLNRRKTKTLPKSFVDDGLDYLLDLCGYGEGKDSLNLEKELQEAGDDFKDDITIVTNFSQKSCSSNSNQNVTKTDKNSDNDDYDNTSSEEEVDGDHSDMEKDFENLADEKMDFSDNDEEKEENNNGKNAISQDSDEMTMSEEYLDSNENDIKEDIYGRLIDKSGNIIKTDGKYIPPHLRAKPPVNLVESNENILALSKQMKGLLNRLTGSNMHSISSQLEHMYMKHSRHDVNSVLLKLSWESLLSSVIAPERIVIEHAMLISVLHANVGSEIGANILQHLVEEFDKLIKQNNAIEDKRIDNVLLFLCQLYNFKLFNSCLLYDVLNKLIEKFQEKEIELILIILRNVGFNLRKDDPLRLKEFIISVQKKSNEIPNLKDNFRVRFMIETLIAVKNNNTLKVQNYDSTYSDHLKKILKTVIRKGNSVSELRISLEDLLNAETRGRWWIVGSAWSGNIGLKEEIKEVPITLYNFDKKILDLAKKNRMNTDTRKNIFCILMSAEDYIEAFEKLTKLGLKGQQYQEIIHVLMHCLLKEKKYNPYYSYVAEQFCILDRKYQLTVQFSTWDKFKEINSLSNTQITNLAKFLSYLFLEQRLPLSVLKALQFTEMNKRMVRLVRQVVLAILLNDDENVVMAVFSRISKSEKLFMLREGLQLFLHHFILKNIDTTGTAFDDKLELLPKRVELAENAMRGLTSRNF